MSRASQVENGGARIAFVVAGSGPPVVLGHSFLCSGEMWREQVPHLAREHTVVNVDARGHGASGPTPGPFTLDDMVGDVLTVLDHLGLEQAVWAGLSIGGMVALRAALLAPERVTGLVLVDTEAGAETDRWTRMKYRTLGGVVRLFGIRPVLSQVERQMFGATTRRARADLAREWRERFASVHVPSALRMLDALLAREDLGPRLAEVRVPALVLVGAEDRSLPPSRSRRLAAGLTRARLVEVPGAGHLSALEQPEIVTREILEFLREEGESTTSSAAR